MIQEFAMGDRLLTDDECIGLSKGICPKLYTNNLRVYVPMIRNVLDRRKKIGNTGGGAVQNPGRVIGI